MSQSKIFLLIVTLVAIGVMALVINYVRQPSPEIQPIELPATEEARIVEIEKIKDEIRTEVEGEIVKYRGESFYSEDDFSVILENEEEFKSQLIERFKQSLIGVSAENFKVDLNQSEKSAILKCEIRGAEYASEKYDMHFLLGNWSFDLMDFSREERKLTYEGKIDGVPTKIVFEFPYTLSHCHEHIWPK